MYRVVNTDNDLITFREIWGDYCEIKQLPYIEKNSNCNLVLMIDNADNPIGTLECTPYLRELSNLEYFYPFSKVPLIQSNDKQNIYEIAKVSIKRDARGKGYFNNIMLTIYTFAVKNNIDWFIAVMTYRMYLFTRTMGFDVEELDQPFYIGDEMKVVPVLLNAKHGIEHMKTFREFQSYCISVSKM